MSFSDAATSDSGCVGSSCQLFDCPDGQVPTVCGCDAADSDGDGTPDCADQCPSDRNKKLLGSCGCGESDRDTDLDGVPDCSDKCSGQADAPYVPDGSCGVGYCRSHSQASSCVNGVETQCKPGQPLDASDSSCDGIDDDCDGEVDEDFGMRGSSCGEGACGRTGTVSCVAGKVVDSCVASAVPAGKDDSCNDVDDDCDGEVDEDYPAKTSSCAAGACASTGMIACSDGKVVDSCSARAPISDSDVTCNNLDDDCDGKVDEDYESSATMCGVGACASTGSTSCSRGKVVDSCRPAAKPSVNDTSCNNVDDDCNGKVDDGFVASTTQCGQGVCIANGMQTCSSGRTQDSCVPGAPKSVSDDSFVPGNGLDDDCDGRVDEDAPACSTAPLTFEAGFHANIAVPGNCRSVTVSLWGGGGGGGEEVGGGAGGAGGPGGFVSGTALINGRINLSVGGGGGSSCNAAGGNAEAGAYNGGSGGGGSGDPGGDGNARGGGEGGGPSSGQRGGSGHFGGGGGGGASNGGFGARSGDGGGGGAASVLTINGVRAAVAGGGGGGGGAQEALFGAASRGGAGGSGCGADGRVETSSGGGGGGGGLCIGGSTQTGAGTTPASSDRLPSGRARGGSSSCNAGGAGYAIITFSP